MSKKILFMSSAKLTALSIGLLLAVFCTIGMSFRPVYDEQETAEIVMSGPRRSHWTTTDSYGCDTRHNVTDYGRVNAISKGGGSTSVSGTNAYSVSSDSEETAAGSTSYVIWNTGFGNEGVDSDIEYDPLSELHENLITFTAVPQEGKAFVGWYSDEECTNLLSEQAVYTEKFVIPGGSYEYTERNPQYESSNNPYTENRYAKFQDIVPVDLTFFGSTGGSYTVSIHGEETTVTTGDVAKTGITSEVSLVAMPAEGYVFAGWYAVNASGKVSYMGLENTYSRLFAQNTMVGAHFVSTSNTRFEIYETGSTYYGLQAAIMAASFGETIVPLSDYVLDGSDAIRGKEYVIPTGVTLLIPYEDDTYEWQITEPGLMNGTTAAQPMSPFRKLTVKEGVNIVCNGTLCVGGQADSGTGGNPSGYVSGAFGMIDMSSGGHIELNEGATLYCWGFIKGQDMDQGNNTLNVGTIKANSGSVVWEDFAVGDYRGGTATKDFVDQFFPFQSYFIQNIEIPVTYEYGSELKNYFTIQAGGSSQYTKFTIIGSENALFKLTDSQSQVRKWYDPTTDLTCYELSGTSEIDEIQMKIDAFLFTLEVKSGDYILPITSNMHVILTNSHMTLKKPMQLQPGSVIEIKDDAEVTVATDIYLYDKDEWGKYINSRYFRQYGDAYPILTSHKDRGNGTTNDLLDDAKFIVDGKLIVSGNLYTSASGANIMGNGGGSVQFASALPEETQIKWYTGTTTEKTEDDKGNKTGVEGVHFGKNPMYAANLCNEDGSYTRSIASKTFHNVNGRWFVDGKENEKADHTYDFTYMAEGNTGDDVNTLAVYSTDKTSLETGYKWANVVQDEGCSDNYNAADDIIYNYTKNNAWTQFIPDERPNGYSGSDNKLYTKDGCVFTDPVAIDDETCLYPFEDGNKALVDGTFIALTPNAYDAAYKDGENKYYICFKGCNWHEATPYEGESKTYNVVEGGTYIWYDNDWTRVERGEDDPFFYTTNEQNVKTYYEYVDGEWIVATPYVAVIDDAETRELFSLPSAFTIASAKRDATIKFLRDFTQTVDPFTFTGSNSTCTLDLNGHTAEIAVVGAGTTEVKMVTINAAGATFVITDNSGYGTGELKLIANINTATATKRWVGVYVANGTLELESGKLYVENHFTHTSTSNTGIVSGVQLVAGAGRNFEMDGGILEASGQYSTCGVHAVEGNGATITINDGTINAQTATSTTCYGILAYGTTNIYGGTINATTKTTTAYGLYVNCSTKAQGKLNVYGGEINASATTGTATGVYVGGLYAFKNTKPNAIKTTYRATAKIYGGTFNVKTINSSKNTAYGILTLGTTTISGGTFNVTPNGTTAYGILAQDGTTELTTTSTSVFNVKATTVARGIYANGKQPDDKTGRPYNPQVTVNGGKFDVQATSTEKAYGISADGNTRPITSTNSGYYAGNYASAGEVTVNGGEFVVYAKTKSAYGFTAGAAKTESGSASYAAATSTPKVTINGGKFKISSGTASNGYVTNYSSVADIKVYGGYYKYTHKGKLDDFIVSPKTAVALTDAKGNCPDENYPEYTHKVAEAYLITFMNGEEQLQSTLQNAGVAAVYNGAEPQKADDGDNSYEFDGWATTADGEVAYKKGVELPNVSEAATYYAHFATTAKKYIITWNANGGTCATELTRVEATGSATVGTLPEATKAGYDFEGWFTATEGENKITAETVVTEHVTYYAHYTIHSHTLTWDANGGAIAGTYTHGSVNYGAAITAPTNANVTREGYTFAGWDATPVTTMPDNNLTYTASWTPKTNTAYKVVHKIQRTTLDGYDVESTDNLTGTTGAYVTPDTKSYEGYRTPAKKTVQILANGSLAVEYLYDCITYTIAFDATTNGGTCDQAPVTIIYGGKIGDKLTALPTEPNVSKEGNDFVGWFSKAVGGEAITLETTFKYNVGAIYAQFRAKPELVIGDNESDEVQGINVSNNSTVTTTTVHTNGSLNIVSGRTLTTTNLILESDAENEVSGEIEGNVVATNAYFDLKLNTLRRHWRAFSVPFEIDLKQHPILADGISMPLGVQYDIVYYDGAERAAHGKTPDCWRYVEDDANWILTPGRAYMIVFGCDVNTVRFTKKDGASVKYTGTVSVSENHSDRTGGTDGGWNGIGNPATYHAMLSAGVTECQVHNGEEIGSDGYTPCDMGKFIVGKAVFVQVAASQSVVVNRATVSDELIKPQAPRRATATTSGKNRFDVQIAPENGKMADRMFLLADEDKEDKYVILSDLAKAGLSTKRAQIWVDRYDTKLCKNTAVLTNGQAEYPLGIFAPAAGDYTIQLTERPDEETMLYLTYDGAAIWNLTYGDYVASLEKGTTSRYGLRLVRNTPQIATGIDEAVVDAQGETKKVLINDQVFIIRGEKVYTIDGQLVK